MTRPAATSQGEWMFALQRCPSADTILRKVRGGKDPDSGEFDVDRVDKMRDVGSGEALDAFTIVEGVGR